MSKKKHLNEEELKDIICGCGEECICEDDCNCNSEHKCTDECTCDENCNCTNECNCDDDCDCDSECACNDECACKENNDSELLLKRIKNLEEALLRNQAELMNYKKRKDEEVSRILKYAEEDILKGFLPVLDNFERAIGMDDENMDDEVSKFLEGFKLMYKQIKDLLNKFDVKEIETLDKEFDPATSQAVIVDKDESRQSGVVLEVLQKGYIYRDRVLRTAMVKVNE